MPDILVHADAVTATARKSVHYVEQANQLPDIKGVREDVRAVHRQVLQRLRRRQRRVARRRKFSKRWKKAVRLVAKMHRKVFNQRNDFKHKLSRDIVNNYGLIFVEDLNVKGLLRGLLSRSVRDAGWAAFFPVDPRGTSQRCPCGEPNPKRLPDREHVCVKCGLVTTRDHSSAIEILRLGLSLQPLTAVQQGCC